MNQKSSRGLLSIFFVALFFCAQLFSFHAVLNSFDGETLEHQVPNDVVIDPFLAPHVRTIDVAPSVEVARVVATALVAALLSILAIPLADAAASGSLVIDGAIAGGARGNRVWLLRRRLLI